MISFVYFDLGGVVIIDFAGTNKSEELKHDLGLNSQQAIQFDAIVQQYSDKYDFNINYDIDRLLPVFEKELGLTLPQEYSFLADLVNRFEPNPSLWPLLTKAKQTYKIGLLTNMFPRMFEMIQARNIMPTIDWDTIIDSSAVGLQKPHRDMFELAEKRMHAKGNELLFVDNSKENTLAAERHGWQTFLYDPSHPNESNKKLKKLLFD